MWKMVTFREELPIAWERFQWDVLQLWHSWALSQVLPKSTEDKRKGARKREKARWERQLGKRKRWNVGNLL